MRQIKSKNLTVFEKGVDLIGRRLPVKRTHRESTSKLFLFSFDYEQIKWYSFLLERLLVSATTGYKMAIVPSGNYIYYIVSTIFIAALSLPLWFLFRKEPWMIKLTSKAVPNIKENLKNSRFVFLTFLLSTVGYLAVVSMSLPKSFLESLLNISSSLNRYIYILVPFVCGITVMIVYSAITHIPLKKHKKLLKNLAIIITGFCVAAVLIYQNVSCDNYFLFRAKNENGRVNDYIAGSDCIVLTNGPTIQNLVPYMLIDADDVFLYIPIWNTPRKRLNLKSLLIQMMEFIFYLIAYL